MHSTQKQLLDLITAQNIGDLSYRKISALIPGGNSAQNIKHHLQQLAKRGLIRIDKNKKTISRIKSGVKNESNLIPIPILGSANCGEALLFANETPSGHLSVSPAILGSKLMKKTQKLFALMAVGPSMNRCNVNGDNIEEGDYVIIDGKRTVPKNNDCVVSIIDGCANIKHFFKDEKNQRIVLCSDSTENIPPIYIHESDLKEYIINGTVVLVMKTPNRLQAFLDAGAKDMHESLPKTTQKEDDYYMSLPQ
ncbi:hypothetical protein KKG71_01175 [Patescibacteria group bacterium]|nr:hypothetical protein [Patescibacteria group bacterium]